MLRHKCNAIAILCFAQGNTVTKAMQVHKLYILLLNNNNKAVEDSRLRPRCRHLANST